MRTKRFKRFWTSQEDADLVARSNDGQSVEQIARALGRSVEGVKRRRQIVAAEIVDYIPRRLWTPQEDAQLIAMLNAGQTAAETACALSRSIASVHTRTDVLRHRCASLLPPTRLEIARSQVLPPISPPTACAFVTDQDRAWMAYWRQPRAVRLAQAGEVSP